MQDFNKLLHTTSPRLKGCACVCVRVHGQGEIPLHQCSWPSSINALVVYFPSIVPHVPKLTVHDRCMFHCTCVGFSFARERVEHRHSLLIVKMDHGGPLLLQDFSPNLSRKHWTITVVVERPESLMPPKHQPSLDKDQIIEVLKTSLEEIMNDPDKDIPWIAEYLQERLKEAADKNCLPKKSRSGKPNWANWVKKTVAENKDGQDGDDAEEKASKKTKKDDPEAPRPTKKIKRASGVE